MKTMRRLISYLLLITLVSSVFLTCPIYGAAAQNTGTGASDARYTQKIVSVVYDNSGSMEAGNRTPAAKYSLAMLMSLLSEKDRMYISPMNKAPSGGITVDLANPDRESVINNIINDPIMNYQLFHGTPPSSMSTAVNILKSNGLKDSSNLIESDPDKEYWLVILTDGLFNDVDDASTQAGYVADAIKNYPTLHTVYVSFGDGAIDISGQSKLNGLGVTTHCKVSENPSSGVGDDLVSVMQKIANQISGRYTLSSNQYTVNGNKVTIDLSAIPFSLTSLSAIAQDCGATVKSAVYTDSDSATHKCTLSKVCTVRPDSALGINNGCAFEVTSDTYMYGGSLVLEFSGDVKLDSLSIFAEPALDISYYIEALVDNAWKKVDAQYINANLRKSDKIRVGYEVHEQATNSVIDLEQVFGNVLSNVSYCQNTYKMGDEISLVLGSNELSVEVSVMDGAYTLRDSEILTVEEDPSFFRIESEGNTEVEGADPTASATFTVYVDNAPATRDVLKDYVCTAKATNSSGEVLYEKTVQPSNDGKIKLELDIQTNEFDVYTLSLSVVSPKKLSREKGHDVTYVPSSLELSVISAEHLSITQYNLKDNKEGFVFSLTANGKPFPIINTVTKHSLIIGGIDVTEHAEVSGSTLIYVPTEANIGDLINDPGDKALKLSITSATRPQLNCEAEAKLTVIKTVYQVLAHEASSKTIDKFDLKNCTAVLYFKVERDGVSLPYDELSAALESGALTIENTPLFDFFLFPAKITKTVEELDGTPVIAVRAQKDMWRYFEWHFSTLIQSGDKPITVSYMDAETTESFNVAPANIFSHIIRWLGIIWLLHLIPFVISLFIAKKLPVGYVLYLSGGMVGITPINVNPVKHVALWLLWIGIRFLVPGFEFFDQPLWFQDPGLGDYPITFDRKEGLNFTPIDSESYFTLRLKPQYKMQFGNFLEAVSKGEQAELADYLPRGAALKKLFVKSKTASLRSDAQYGLSLGVYYGIFGKDMSNNVELSSILTFLEL